MPNPDKRPNPFPKGRVRQERWRAVRTVHQSLLKLALQGAK